jgi:PAS domain-containing protein
MHGHNVGYVDAHSKPAVLSWSRSEISHCNAAAAGMLEDPEAHAAIVHMLTVALEERRSVDGYVWGREWIAVPLFDETGAVEAVLAMPGELGDVPLLLHTLGGGLRRVAHLLHVLPNVVLTARPDGRFDFANARWYEKTGGAASSYLVDEAFWQAIDPQDTRRLRDEWRERTRVDHAFRTRFRITLAAGDARWHEMRANPWVKRQRVIKWIVSIIDVHETVVAELSSVKLVSRLRLLAEVGDVLESEQKPNSILQAVSRVVANNLSAICRIDLSGDDAAGETSSPAQRRLAAWLPARVPAFVEFLSPASGTPRSIIALPLGGEPAQPGFPAGIAILARDAPSAPLSEDDYAAFEAIVARTAAAFALAAHSERSGRIATRLQRSMLPDALPQVPGVAFEVCYRPAEEQTLVGGDWYDAFLLPRGKAAIMIGDVSGHGIEAAISMNRLRQSFRTVAMNGEDPGAILSAVNRLAWTEGDPFATAFLAVLDPMTYELRYAGAGHPPGFIAGRDGAVTALASDGPPLSVVRDYVYRSNVLQIATGTALVLYTDGLIEFDRDVMAGERRLVDVLQEWSRNGFAGDAEALQAAVLGGHPTADDAALLIARFPAVPDLELTFPATAFDALRARAALERFVATSTLRPQRATEILRAAADAIADCVRHANRDVAGAVTLSLHRDDKEVSISVSDSAAWLEQQASNGDDGRAAHSDGGTAVRLREPLSASVAEDGG